MNNKSDKGIPLKKFGDSKILINSFKLDKEKITKFKLPKLKIILISTVICILAFVTILIVKSGGDDPLKVIEKRHTVEEGSDIYKAQPNEPKSAEATKSGEIEGRVYESKHVRVKFNEPDRNNIPREEEEQPKQFELPKFPPFESDDRQM